MRKKLITTLLVLSFYLLLWQVGSLAVGRELVLPSPYAVLLRVIALVGTPSFWVTTGMSLLRVFAGYIIGILVGVGLAVACHALGWLKALVAPLMSVVRATPVASFIIITLYFLAKGKVPTLMSFLMVLPIVFGNVLEGLTRTDPQLLAMASLFRVPKRRMVRFIILPSVLPYAIAASLTSLGLAWKAGIAAEVLGSPAFSIGLALRESKAALDTPDLFAWTLVVILLSLALEFFLSKGLRMAGRRFAYVPERLIK